jgi:hypothetical protein
MSTRDLSAAGRMAGDRTRCSQPVRVRTPRRYDALQQPAQWRQCGRLALDGTEHCAAHLRPEEHRRWRRVIFSSQCDEDGNCGRCGVDYAECGCPGPTQDGWEYRSDKHGVMWAREEIDPA